jgi:hypothetical protein
MEIFVPDREDGEVMALMRRLHHLGIRGRDAAYLAGLTPPTELGSPERNNYLKDFQRMVAAESRASAAALIGLGFWREGR